MPREAGVIQPFETWRIPITWNNCFSFQPPIQRLLPNKFTITMAFSGKIAVVSGGSGNVGSAVVQVYTRRRRNVPFVCHI